MVSAALNAGIILFDVVGSYGTPAGISEERLGAAPSSRRDEAVIASTFGVDASGANGADRGSRRCIRRAVETSLRRLGTDRTDP